MGLLTMKNDRTMPLLENENMLKYFSAYLGLFLPDSLQEICQDLL